MDSYLSRLQQQIVEATAGVDLHRLTRHPEGKWSIAQILEHLSLTYSGTAKGFERCLQAGKPLAGSPSWIQRRNIFVVVGLGYMPGGRKSPEPAAPRDRPAEEVVRGIGPLLASMDAAIQRCEQRYGARVPLLDHPILGPMTASQWRKFHWVHGRHHLKQVASLLNS